MFCIITYDIRQERVGKVCSFLRRYINWVQNSVFEGEISESKILEIKNYLETTLDKSVDSVFIYKIRSKDELSKDIIGIEKADTSRLI